LFGKRKSGQGPVKISKAGGYGSLLSQGRR
jgi:hypothetical protein